MYMLLEPDSKRDTVFKYLRFSSKCLLGADFLFFGPFGKVAAVGSIA